MHTVKFLDQRDYVDEGHTLNVAPNQQGFAKLAQALIPDLVAVLFVPVTGISMAPKFKNVWGHLWRVLRGKQTFYLDKTFAIAHSRIVVVTSTRTVWTDEDRFRKQLYLTRPVGVRVDVSFHVAEELSHD